MTRHVFTNANLLDGNSPIQSGTTVIVEGEHITDVITNGQHPVLRDSDQLYDLTGKTLMPGMTSGHFHTTYHNLGAEPGFPTAEHPPAFTAYRGLANAQLALRAGFTAVVGAGCSYDIDPSLEQAIEQGLFEGPRLEPCSRDILSSYDNLMPWWLEIPIKSGVDNCDGPDELRKAVRRNAQRGARMIKLTTSGGHGVPVSSGLRVFSFEEIRAAVEAAHDLGLRVRAHVVGKPFILECIRAGVDILDHCDFMDEECIEAIVEADILVLPSLYLPSKMLDMPRLFGFTLEQTRKEFEWMCNILPKAVEAGVKLCVGDDFGTPIAPHGEYGKELAVYVEHAGIEPLEVI
ncbi:MAG: amidohydrolase family protein, partial [Tissierellales bacterium]